MPPTVEIDPNVVPWSKRGSYLSFSVRSGDRGRGTPAKDVYLVTHHIEFGSAIFALRPLAPGDQHSSPDDGFPISSSSFEWRATPGRLACLRHGEVMVECTFHDEYTVRLRGTLPLALYTDGIRNKEQYVYRLPQLSASSLPQIQWALDGVPPIVLTALQGDFDLANEESHKSGRITVANDKASWEMLISEVRTKPKQPMKCGMARPTMLDDSPTQLASIQFNDLSASMESEFLQYATQICPWRNGGEPLVEELSAAYILYTSTVRPDGFLGKEGILMSKLWMNKIWSWDNCFICLAVAPLSLQNATDQLLAMFEHQLPSGQLPDFIHYAKLGWSYVKPPVYGWTLRKLFDGRDPRDLLCRADLETLYFRIAATSKFWLEQRVTTISPLPWYSHGNDSGWDNSTNFDGRRVIISADLTAHLAVQADFLAELAEMVAPEKRVGWIDSRDKLIRALTHELWDGEEFVVQDVHTGAKYRTGSLLNMIPLVAARLLPEEVVEKMVSSIPRWLTAWGLATEALDSPLHLEDNDAYWRGPIWAPTTLLIESGLRDAGYTDLANTISDRYRKLCAKSGFAENYDAKSGRPNRDLAYTWSASVYLVLVAEAAERGKASRNDRETVSKEAVGCVPNGADREHT